ncbi:hypothetical protein C8R46DRAFT_465326 [Mycena filopes]|nr:hypothetical protein C8R46DRAFT_465326 [Mycena filopes]
MQIDTDVFTCILSHISDAKTLYSVLAALPTSHVLFPSALARLWQLPVYLDSYDLQVAVASQSVLEQLLQDNAGHPLVESVRHLVVAVEYKPPSGARRGRGRRAAPTFRIPVEVTTLHKRLPDLLSRAVNLESLDYHSFPGFPLKNKHVRSLQNLEWLRRFAVDCALRSRDRELPAGMGPGDWSAVYDAENWEMELFISAVGPRTTSLDLRHVNHTMFMALTQQTDVFASYHDLERLKIDITEGVWDWNGNGSPASGAEPGFTFPFLGFPSVKHLELTVCDKTLTGSARAPLNLVHCGLLTSLTIDVRRSLAWMSYETIKLFEALSPFDFPVLSFLQVKDNTRNAARHYWKTADDEGWYPDGRTYPGLVPSFLGGINSGALPNLTALWVDECVLLPSPSISIQHLLASVLPPSAAHESIDVVSWTESLKATLAQLESLRVGFGAIDVGDAEAILELCDPQKLTQFGFEWNWWEYEHDEPLAPGLLDQLSRFPKLTDVHILFPRPETHLAGLPDPKIDALTLADVGAVFRCNATISRVGIGNSLVWERHPVDPDDILLVSDGSVAANPAVPRFFHAGYLARQDSRDIADNAVSPRPKRGEEIEQLRDLLQRIVG